MKVIALGALLLVMPATASATAKPAHAAASKSHIEDAVKKAPDFRAVMAMFDKLFPPQPEPDPVRLALARTSVAAMWPDGAYGRMMTGLVGGVFDRAMTMKASDLASLDPKAAAAKEGAPKDDPSLHDLAAAGDPHFDERMAAIRAAVTEEMGKVSAIVDPRMRDGIARSMARRFDAQQLTDINAFFATASGRALASQYMQLMVDPDALRSMFGSVPEMMKLMPGMMEKIKSADARFPRPAKRHKDGK